MTGTERLYGPPLRAAHLLHERVKAATQLNCSIGIATSRLVAKITSDQAKPNGVLWVIPGQEAAFLAPLDVRKVPGVGKVTEKNLHALGIRKVGDLARLDEAFLEAALRQVGPGAGRQIARPRCGRLVRHRDRRRRRPRSPSATSTPSARTRPTWTSSNPRWRGSAKWWAAACASTGCMRAPSSSSCATPTSPPSRARTRSRARRSSIPRSSRRSASCSAATGSRARRSGCSACRLVVGGERCHRADGPARTKTGTKGGAGLAAADRLRDKFGESAVSLAAGAARDVPRADARESRRAAREGLSTPKRGANAKEAEIAVLG